MKRTLAVGLLPCLIALGCAALPSPMVEDLPRITDRWPGVRLADLREGRRLYVAHCASCHTLYLPSGSAPDRWGEVMTRMQPKARIDDPTRDAILVYLRAYAKEDR